MPPPERQRRPAGGAAPSALGCDRSAPYTARPYPAQALRLDHWFRRLTDRLWLLGPRPVSELLLELANEHDIAPAVMAKLEKFSRIDRQLLETYDGRRWPPMPPSEVAA